jgi:hypothetical protein
MPEAYVSIHQHTSAYVSILDPGGPLAGTSMPEAYVSIFQHTSAYVSILDSGEPLGGTSMPAAHALPQHRKVLLRRY